MPDHLHRVPDRGISRCSAERGRGTSAAAADCGDRNGFVHSDPHWEHSAGRRPDRGRTRLHDEDRIECPGGRD